MAADARFVRTTVSLREDLYQRLKGAGSGISEQINAILAEALERDPELFGAFPDLDAEDLRDHEDRV